MRIAFPGDQGIQAAASTAKSTLNCGVIIGRCELMDETMIQVLNQANSNLSNEPWLKATTLLYEIPGISEAAVQEAAMIVQNIAYEHGAQHIDYATTPESCKEIWRMRKEALWSIMSVYSNREPLITDVCVPLSELPNLIVYTQEEIHRLNLVAPIVAHAGDGNFHVRMPMFKIS